MYDLSIGRAESVPELRSGTAFFRNVLRTEFRIRNRRTHDTTDFTVTYGVDGELAGVPIQATYQPNWWFRIQLALDDRFEPPADPCGDERLASPDGPRVQ